MDVLLPLLTLALGLLLGAVAVFLWQQRRQEPALEALAARGRDQAVVQDGLQRLEGHLRALREEQVVEEARLQAQVEEMRHATEAVRRETGALATALRRPHVRGQWGELQLRRTVEVAGMVQHCDFSLQQSRQGEDRLLRPDLVVHLAGGKSVVVDSKVPLSGHLDALGTEDPDEQLAHLRRHAAQVRTHVTQLGAKAYWKALPNTPEFVILFVPMESSLPAALDIDPSLLEYAAQRNVFLATPTTLMTLLRTVAHGWTQETLAERTREVHELGRVLYERLGTMGGHLDKLGRALTSGVLAYNQAIGSLEGRVLVTARGFADLAEQPDTLRSPQPVEEPVRRLSARELLDEATPRRTELDDREPRGVSSPPEDLRDLA